MPEGSTPGWVSSSGEPTVPGSTGPLPPGDPRHGDLERDCYGPCPQKLSHQILLKGAAREHMMFVEGGDPLDVPVESLTVIPTCDPEHREGVFSEVWEPPRGV